MTRSVSSPLRTHSPGVITPEVAAAAAQDQPGTGLISAKPWTGRPGRATTSLAGPLKCLSVH